MDKIKEFGKNIQCFCLNLDAYLHTCTASANKSTPFKIAARPSTPNFISFPENNLRAPTFGVDVVILDENVPTCLDTSTRFRDACIIFPNLF